MAARVLRTMRSRVPWRISDLDGVGIVFVGGALSLSCGMVTGVWHGSCGVATGKKLSALMRVDREIWVGLSLNPAIWETIAGTGR